jgi:FKBP-type peptidyl-prolyl cis-trans isomerase
MLVNSNPSLPQSMRDNATVVAQQAITQATTAIAASKTNNVSSAQPAPSQTSAPVVSTALTGLAALNALGINAQDITIGTGETAVPGSNVSVTYVGKLQDGTVFDSSARHDNQPLTFVLGAPGQIRVSRSALTA